MNEFVHEYVFSFSKSIDKCVQNKNNQTLDLLIKYVAYYHILKSGLSEIRLSVFVNLITSFKRSDCYISNALMFL